MFDKEHANKRIYRAISAQIAPCAASVARPSLSIQQIMPNKRHNTY